MHKYISQEKQFWLSCNLYTNGAVATTAATIAVTVVAVALVITPVATCAVAVHQ